MPHIYKIVTCELDGNGESERMIEKNLNFINLEYFPVFHPMDIYYV